MLHSSLFESDEHGDGSSVHGLQGLNALILGGNFVERYNYYEDYIDLHKTKWW